MKWSWLVLLLSASTSWAAAQEGLAIAWADSEALDPTLAKYTRYLDATHLTPEWRAIYSRQGLYQCNLLSRKTKKVKLRFIANGTMAAFDLRDIAEDKADVARVWTVWERLFVREPYYHQRKEVEEPGGVDQYNRPLPAKRVIKPYFPDFLRQDTYAKLRASTHSGTPIVTMDWFFTTTSIEADRGADEAPGKFKATGGGYGYYDFLGINNRDDFFKLAGVNLKEKRSEQDEYLAIVMAIHSGVAQKDRVIVRRPAIGGFLWFTLDFFDNNLDERNPMLILDPKKGLKHQAERHFATLPNKLPVVIACNDKGELQTYAPGEIGFDKTVRGNDGRIHPAKSCLSCHSQGYLKDINDEVRKVYKFDPKNGYNLLSTPNTSHDKDYQDQLESQYLRDFRVSLELDRIAYEQATREVIAEFPFPADADGKPIDKVIPLVSAEYREAYQHYVTDPMTLEDVCRGIGVPVPEFQAKLKAYRKVDQLSTHILTPLSTVPPSPVTRNNYETLYPLLQIMARGVPVP